MKTLHFTGLITIIFFNIGITNAQNGYLNINAGYGFSMASQRIGTDLTSNSETIVRGTFGKGINLGGCLGFKFKDHFCAELGVNYIIGSKYELTNTSAYYLPETINLKGKMLKLIPAFKIVIGEKTKGYVRIGLALGVLNRIIVDDDFTQYPSERVHSTEIYSGRISFGLNTALGIEKMTSEHFGFFAELNSTAQSWSPKRSEYIKYDINGVDQLPSMTTKQKQFEYVSTYDPNAAPNSALPKKQLKSYFPFSNVGISLGVKIIFGKKDK